MKFLGMIFIHSVVAAIKLVILFWFVHPFVIFLLVRVFCQLSLDADPTISLIIRVYVRDSLLLLLFWVISLVVIMNFFFWIILVVFQFLLVSDLIWIQLIHILDCLPSRGSLRLLFTFSSRRMHIEIIILMNISFWRIRRHHRICNTWLIIVLVLVVLFLVYIFISLEIPTDLVIQFSLFLPANLIILFRIWLRLWLL